LNITPAASMGDLGHTYVFFEMHFPPEVAFRTQL
jgi:hypothetical protein